MCLFYLLFLYRRRWTLFFLLYFCLVVMENGTDQFVLNPKRRRTFPIQIEIQTKMNIFEIFAILFVSVSSVHAIALLPSPQNTNWYAGETVKIQAVQNADNDGSFYNAYMKSGELVEQVLFEATYQEFTSFVVPDAFDNIGSATLYVVSEGNTNKDSMKVFIYNFYDYNQLHPRNRRARDYMNSPASCTSCRF